MLGCNPLAELTRVSTMAPFPGMPSALWHIRAVADDCALPRADESRTYFGPVETPLTTTRHGSDTAPVRSERPGPPAGDGLSDRWRIGLVRKKSVRIAYSARGVRVADLKPRDRNPGADVAGRACAQSRCRCGRGEPSPGAEAPAVIMLLGSLCARLRVMRTPSAASTAGCRVKQVERWQLSAMAPHGSQRGQ